MNKTEGLVVVINEDPHAHTFVEVSGLSALEGKTLHPAHGDESVVVMKGRALSRLQPYEVNVFTTQENPAPGDQRGRDFGLSHPRGSIGVAETGHCTIGKG
jgi:hypothetical protein